MYHAVVLLGARPALVATQPLEAPRRARRRQLADERRERAPRGDREDDKRLKRVDSLDIVCAVGRERTAHVPLKLTEDGPAVDHRGEIPLARTKAGFVEILPDASPEAVLEVRVTVDRVLRQRWRHHAARRVAENRARLPTDEIRDAQRIGTRIKTAQGSAVGHCTVVERAQRSSCLRSRSGAASAIRPEGDVPARLDMRARIDERGGAHGALAERLREGDPARERLQRTHQVREAGHAGDHRRGPKVDQDVHPSPEHHALVEREAEPAREGGGELLFHAVILCGRGRSAEC